MKAVITIFLAAASTISIAQTTLTNGGFENWGGNAAPGVAAEPTSWYSNKSGSNVAALGPQTCFQDNAIKHSGTSSVRVETISQSLGPLGTVVVNGNVTTGIVNAPTTTKTDGYIGTINYSAATDIRRMSFTGRPDSIVGWYQYTKGGTGERAKLRAILHTGNYFDPETPTTNHPDSSVNKVGDAFFQTDTNSVATWTRFSVPFTYVKTTLPAYIMISATSSANQATTIAGSKLWLDDLDVIYKQTNVSGVLLDAEQIKVYNTSKTVYIDFLVRSNGHSDCAIYDLSGKQILKANLSNNQLNTVDVSNVVPGIYLYQIICNGFKKSGKLVIQ